MPLPYQLETADIRWEAGTPRSNLYGDIYWHQGQAVEEKRFVFLAPFMRQQAAPAKGAKAAPSLITSKMATSSLSTAKMATCAELGFGFGLNCLLTCGHWQDAHPGTRLDYISIERHPVSKADLKRLLHTTNLPLADKLIEHWPLPLAGMHVIWLTQHIRLLLVLDDASRGLAELDAQVDAWYLDGFAPSANPDIWAADIYRKMFARSRPGALVATYSAAGKVRRGLEAAGFMVQKVAGFGRKQEMLQAHKPGNWQPQSFNRGKLAILGGGLAGYFCAEAAARRGLEPLLLDKGQAAVPSRIPQLAVYPQLAARPEARYRFSLLAHQYMLTCPGFEESGLRFFPQGGSGKKQDEVQRLQKIARQFTDDFIAWQGTHLWFASGGWWNLDAFREASGIDNHCEKIEGDVTGIERAEDGWVLNVGSDPGCKKGKSGVRGRKSLHTDNLILATGADKRLLGDEPEIRMVRGQALSLPAFNPSDLSIPGEWLDGVITGPVTIFPGWRGKSVISGTYGRGTDLAPNENDTAQLLRAAGRFIDPRPTSFNQEAFHEKGGDIWTGIRAASRDRLPIIDAMPNWQDPSPAPSQQAGLYLCMAFGSRGATHARLGAEYLISKLLGEASPLGRSQGKMLAATRFRQRDSC